jgi:molecular chaperone Hsp33
MTPPPGQDSVLRAMTDDGAFRVVTVRSTDTVREALQRQGARGELARQLAELVTGAVLVRETMAPAQRLQCLWLGPGGKQRLVADTHPDGGTRALVQGSHDDKAPLLIGGTLEVQRTLYNGELHRGTVEVPAGHNVSKALMGYMAGSEQVASMLAVCCAMDGEQVVAAGGYIVQLLPEVGRGPLAIMAERLTDFEDIDALLRSCDAQPRPILHEILYGMPFTELEERPLSYKCRCSSVRVMTSLTTLGREELQSIIDAGQVLDLTCDYCGQRYQVSPTQLGGLLEQS